MTQPKKVKPTETDAASTSIAKARASAQIAREIIYAEDVTKIEQIKIKRKLPVRSKSAIKKPIERPQSNTRELFRKKS